jgi:hypothetical protein
MSSRLVESYKTATTLTAHRVVVGSGAHTVAYPASGNVLPMGITIDDQGSGALDIPVQKNGKALLLFNDTVAAGGMVSFDSSGRGVPYVFTNTTAVASLPTGIIGTLDGEAVAATGTIAYVSINPQLIR